MSQTAATTNGMKVCKEKGNALVIKQRVGNISYFITHSRVVVSRLSLVRRDPHDIQVILQIEFRNNVENASHQGN